MFGARGIFGRPKLAVVQAIVTQEHLKIKAAGGSVADAQLASYNRLKEEGLEDVAQTLMLYHTSLMDVRPERGGVNVTLNNSTVGSIAFDSEVSNITTTVNALAQEGGKSATFADALKQLMDGVTSSAELSAEQKKGILELLEMVGQQAKEPSDKRKSTVLQAILESLPKALSVAATLSTLWRNLGLHILEFFK